MKKLLTTLTLLPLMTLADMEVVDDIKWTFTVSNGKSQLSSCTISQLTMGAITIPSTLGGCPVTSIGDFAFSSCSRLTSVTIPSSVTSIGIQAFDGCSGLTSITIPSGVTSIGNGAFEFCSGLTSITIPPSVTSMYMAFRGCSGLKSVTIQEGATNIPEYAFYDCSGLTDVTIPSSVTSMGKLAFGDCGGIETVRISDLTAWCQIKFNFDARSNPLAYGAKLVLKDVEVHDLIIPVGVTSIGDFAFFGCSGLTSLAIPSSVTSIGEYAFSGCSGLMSVTIPSSVTRIGEYAFYGCSGLTSVTIPPSVTSMYMAFRGCSGLKSVTIQEGATNIPECAFYDCSGLTDVTIPSSVTRIGESAFYGCSGLMSVTIPSSVTNIGQCAFERCSGLKSVTIPNCVTCLSTTFPSAYTKIESVVIHKGVTNVNHSMFSDCRRLTSVTIPEGVTSIGDFAFLGCSGLTSLAIPSSVTSIGEWAFHNCSGLTSVTIPSSVARIGEYAFYGCSGLMSVTIPSSVTNIGQCAFERCSGLMSVTIPEGVTNISHMMFYGCSELTSVSIPLSVTSIGESAFENINSEAVLTFDGPPPFAGSKIGSCRGYYNHKYVDEWNAVLDEDGKWRGLKMKLENAPNVVRSTAMDWERGQIEISWEGVAPAEAGQQVSYDVYWSTKSNGTDHVVRENVTGSSCTDDKYLDHGEDDDGICPVYYTVMGSDGSMGCCLTRRRLGLFVGIDKYENPGLEELSTCKNDARQWCDLYTTDLNGANVWVMEDSECTKEAILGKLGDFASEAQVGDVFLYAHSGHGDYDLLCCYDSWEDSTSGDISATEFANALKCFRKGVGVVVVLDACSSGTIPSAMNAPRLLMTAKSSSAPATSAPKSFAESVISAMDASSKPSRVLMSTAPATLQYSASDERITSGSEIGWLTAVNESEDSVDGVFSGDCLQTAGWTYGGADRRSSGNGDGYVDFGELGRFAKYWCGRMYDQYGMSPQMFSESILNNIRAGRVTDRNYRQFLATPQNVAATTDRNNGIEVTWDPVNGAAAYWVCFMTGDNKWHFKSVSGNSFLIQPTDTYDIAFGQPIQIYVKAWNLMDVSEHSSTVIGVRSAHYTLKFDANGGVGEMPDEEFVVGIEKRLALNIFECEGYTFGGWGLAPNSVAAAYEDGETVKDVCIFDGDSDTLYAMWIPDVIQITFNYGPFAGKFGQKVFNYTVGTAFHNFPIVTSTKWVIKGWYTAPIGGVRCLAGEVLPFTKDGTLFLQAEYAGENQNPDDDLGDVWTDVEPLMVSVTPQKSVLMEGEPTVLDIALSKWCSQDVYVYLRPMNEAASNCCASLSCSTISSSSVGLCISSGETACTGRLDGLDGVGSVRPPRLEFKPVVCTSSTFDESKVLSEYEGEPFELEVRNVAPELIVVGWDDPDQIMSVVLGQDVVIRYQVQDVAGDIQAGVSVSFAGDGLGSETVAVMDGGLHQQVVRFTTAGTHAVRITARDKDGASAARTLYFSVQPQEPEVLRKLLRVAPLGPSTGLGMLMQEDVSRYATAAGLGAGRVWAAGLDSVSGFVHTFDCGESQTATVRAFGYKVGDVTDGTSFHKPLGDGTYGSGYYDTFCVQLDASGNPRGSSSGYAYQEPSMRDSFLYGWLIGTPTAGGGLDCGTLVAPEAVWGTSAGAFFRLSDVRTESGAYADTFACAVFAKEYLPSDNMGDINADGIPDLAVQRYFGTSAYTDDLADLSREDSDVDELDDGTPFVAKLELRGYGEHLNDALVQLGITGVKPDRVYTDPAEDAKSTLTPLEYLAWTDFKMAHPEATVDDWSPERPTDPTCADTDDDWLVDGFEYWWWYRAHVGWIDEDGNHRYAVGRRYNPESPLGYDVITTTEIEARMDPLVPRIDGYSDDSDGDGLPDAEEYENMTNPFEFDEDGDGLPDGLVIETAVNDDGTLTIINVENPPRVLVLPREIDGCAVTKIGDYALRNLRGTIKVVVPNGIVSIGSAAFCGGYDDLAEVVLPETLEEIGYEAFGFCRYLSEVTIPASVRLMGDRVFAGCGTFESPLIVNFLGEAPESLYPNARPGLGDRKCIIVRVRTGDDWGLVPGSWWECATEALADDGFYRVETNETTGTTIVTGINGTAEGTLILPSEIGGRKVEIGPHVFSGCAGLKRVVIPESVDAISEFAFVGSQVEELYFLGGVPANMRALDPYLYWVDPYRGYGFRPYMFYTAKYEADWKVYYNQSHEYTEPGQFFRLGGYVAFEAADPHGRYPDQKWCFTPYEEGVMLIRRRFVENGRVKSVPAVSPLTERVDEIPENLCGLPVVRIGDAAFAGCSEETISRLNFPWTLRSIGKAAFSGCEGISSVNMSRCPRSGIVPFVAVQGFGM